MIELLNNTSMLQVVRVFLWVIGFFGPLFLSIMSSLDRKEPHILLMSLGVWSQYMFMWALINSVGR